MGLEFSDKKQVDHEDGNGWNNQRFNLRIVTNQQNTFNQRPRIGLSNFKGVCLIEGKWAARIQAGGNRIYLGYYDDERDAAIAYDEAARMFHGQYAFLNFEE